MAKEKDSPARKAVKNIIMNIVIEGRDDIAMDLYNWSHYSASVLTPKTQMFLLQNSSVLGTEILLDVCRKCLGHDDEGFSFSVSD